MKTFAIQQKSSLMSLFRLSVVALSVFLMASQFSSTTCLAASTTIAWNAPTNADGTAVTNLSGYKVYTGTASGSYSQSSTVGNVTSYTANNLTDGATYYFAVTALNGSGQESPFSNEVSKTIAAAPAPTTYTITATAGAGGTIRPATAIAVNQATNGTSTISTMTVAQGSSLTLAITPASGYRVAGVTVDGASVGAVTSYTFSNVTAAHSIAATFTAATTASYSITATAGTGGSISPAGTSSVASGTSRTFTIAAASGYRVAGVTVDGASVGAVSTYTFSNVTANHTIAATFTSTASTGTTYTGVVVTAINCGGTVFTDSYGIPYKADTYSNGGGVVTNSATIAGTTDQSLYRTYRHGYTFSYAIPVANGNYLVKLRFAEPTATAAGQRVFDVTAQGATVLSNLDLYARAGKNTAYTVSIPVSVSNGTLTVGFTGKVDRAIIEGIVVTK